MNYAALVLYSFIPVLIFVTGLIIALVTRAKHPRRSTLAAVGFALLAVGGIVQGLWNVAAVPLQMRFGWSIVRYSVVSTGIGLVELLIVIGAWVLLLLALFRAERKAPVPPPPVPQWPQFPGQRPAGY